MGWLSNKIEQASTCGDCSHSDPQGASGCNCPAGNCVCGT